MKICKSVLLILLCTLVIVYSGENMLKVPDFEVNIKTQKITQEKRGDRLYTSFSDPEKGFYLSITDEKPINDAHYKFELDNNSDFREGHVSLMIDLRQVTNKDYSVTLSCHLLKNFEPGKRYRLHCWVKSDMDNAAGKAFIIMHLDGKHTYGKKEYFALKKWQKIELEYTIPAGNEIKSYAVRIDCSTAGACYWFDG
ncbi:MAG TPA: hypothetical protein DC049_20245, partial [Spirochaetia bacterium]|nr:hypothetical protein [Spirochaetia bacterium]